LINQSNKSPPYSTSSQTPKQPTTSTCLTTTTTTPRLVAREAITVTDLETLAMIVTDLEILATLAMTVMDLATLATTATVHQDVKVVETQVVMIAMAHLETSRAMVQGTTTAPTLTVPETLAVPIPMVRRRPVARTTIVPGILVAPTPMVQETLIALTPTAQSRPAAQATMVRETLAARTPMARETMIARTPMGQAIMTTHMAPQTAVIRRMTPQLESYWRRLAVFSRATTWLRRVSRSVPRLETTILMALRAIPTLTDRRAIPILTDRRETLALMDRLARATTTMITTTRSINCGGFQKVLL